MPTMSAGERAIQRAQQRLNTNTASGPSGAAMPVRPSNPVQPGQPGQQGATQQLGQLMPGQGNFAATPVLQGMEGNGQRTEDAMMARARRLLDPQFADQQRTMEQQLANRGLAPGSEAYDNAVQQFGRQRNDAYESAANAAVMAGTAEQQRLFGNQVTYDQMANQTRIAQLQVDASNGNAAAQREIAMIQAQMGMDQFNAQRQDQGAQTAWQQSMAEQQWNAGQGQQQFANQMALQQMSAAQRQQYFNEMGFFLGGGVPQTGMPTVNAPNVTGAYGNYDQGMANQWQGQMAQYQNQQQQNQSMWGNIAQLGSLAVMACHRELKENIVPIDGLSMIAKFPTYSFNYIGDSVLRIGPMLDELPEPLKFDKDHVNVSSVVFALVSAVQTLTDRITTLEKSYA